MRFEKTKIAKYYSYLIHKALKLYEPFYFKINKDGVFIDEELLQPRFIYNKSKRICDYLKVIRYHNVVAIVFHEPATLFSFVSTIFTFLISILLVVIAIILFLIAPDIEFLKDQYNVLLTGLLALLFSLALILFSPVYLYKQISKMPIEEYGKFIKNNLSESEMISFISYRIWCLCHEINDSCSFLIDDTKPMLFGCREADLHFLKEYKISDTTMLNAERNFNEYVKNLEAEFQKKGNQFDEIKNKLKFVENEIIRIKQLIKECSLKSEISEIELTEHIFEFSPSLQLQYYRKALNNIEDIRMMEDLRNDNIDGLGMFKFKFRQIQLSNEVFRYLQRQSKFKRYQCQNIAFHEYHNYILEMSSTSSSSEALKCYIKLLYKVSSEWLSMSSIDTLESDENIERFNNHQIYFKEKINYIFNKRFSHGGINLHYYFHKIIMLYFSSSPPTLLFNRALVEDFYKLENFRTVLQDDKNLFPLYSIKIIKYILAFFKSYLELSRIRIQDKLRKKLFFGNDSESLGAWIYKQKDSDSIRNFYLITFGFSKTIREVIKNRNSNLNLESTLREYRYNLNHVIFFSEAESKMDSRLIKYSITEDKNKRLENVLVSNPEFLLPLLNKESRILILMGCEAADKSGKVIRTYNYKKELLDFLIKAKGQLIDGGLNNSVSPNPVLNKSILDTRDKRSDDYKANMEFYSKCRIIVICESYKLFDDLSGIHNLFDDQYEEIETYDKELISSIITEEVEDLN